MSTSTSAVHGDAVVFADSDLGRFDFEIFVEFKLYVLQIKDKKPNVKITIQYPLSKFFAEKI